MKIWGNGSDKPLSAKTWNGLIVNSSVTLNTYLLSFYQLHILIYILIFTTNISKKIFKKVFNKRFKKKSSFIYCHNQLCTYTFWAQYLPAGPRIARPRLRRAIAREFPWQIHDSHYQQTSKDINEYRYTCHSQVLDKTSTAAVDPQHLKVEVEEKYVNKDWGTFNNTVHGTFPV